jgi:hypothetical protein
LKLPKKNVIKDVVISHAELSVPVHLPFFTTTTVIGKIIIAKKWNRMEERGKLILIVTDQQGPR